ncbi:MAG: hypothetical protein NTV02_01340 [Candidatus Zambryskibacteria bacterium]|nr:hypothetical protein [Candidatus Zambryskibacteria bacterium]
MYLARIKDVIKNNKTEIIIFFVAIFFSFCAFYFNTVKFQNDDQFTIYRYIENIADGKGFVFNEGERVLGSTTPLFTLLGAILKYIFPTVSTQLLIAVLNSLLISLSAVWFFRLSTLMMSRQFSLASVFIFILHMSKTVSAGMETPLCVLFFLIFLAYVFSGRHMYAALALGGAILTRPDALLVAALACVFWLTTIGFKKTVVYGLVMSAVIFPWTMFATLYFGSPIPQSLVTKSHVSDIVYQPRFQAFKGQLAEMSRMYWGKVIDPENIPVQSVINLLPFLVMVAFGVRYYGKKYWLLFAIPLAYLISYGYSNPVMYPWYISQLTPFWLLCSLLGVYKIYEYVVERVGSHQRWIYAGVITLLVFGPLYGYAQLAGSRGEGSKITLYKMALYIKEHKQVGDTVGLSNIGIVSHTLNDTYIYDFIGLTRKDTLKYYPIKDECLVKNQYVIPPQMVKDMQPDWIIAGEAEWVPCFVQSEWFLSRYKPVYNAGTTAYVWQKIK